MNKFKYMHQLSPGTTVRFARRFRYGALDFSEGVIIEHLQPTYVAEGEVTHGVTRLAVPVGPNRVVVVPISSDMSIALIAERRAA